MQRIDFYNSFLSVGSSHKTSPLPCRYFLGTSGQPFMGGTVVNGCMGPHVGLGGAVGPISNPNTLALGYCFWAWAGEGIATRGAGGCSLFASGKKARAWVRSPLHGALKSPPQPPVPPSSPPSLPQPPSMPMTMFDFSTASSPGWFTGSDGTFPFQHNSGSTPTTGTGPMAGVGGSGFCLRAAEI